MSDIRTMKTVLTAFCCTLLVACSPLHDDERALDSDSTWTIATWNVEHLAYPADQGCKPRSHLELDALRAYASGLQADLVGLQEVASEEAVAQLFPTSDWQIFVSSRPDSEPYECRESGRPSTQQKVAWAVRRGIDVKTATPHPEFGLDVPGLRHGLELVVGSPFGELVLLNVHMKSGCFVDNYSRADSEACQLFSRQAPVLDAWVERQERLGRPYILLGDFNHRLSAPYNHLTRQLNKNSDGRPSALVNTTASLISCHPWYPAPIDHIFAGHLPATTFSQSADVMLFQEMSVDSMLSDHCAMRLTLSRSP